MLKDDKRQRAYGEGYQAFHDGKPISAVPLEFRSPIVDDDACIQWQNGWADASEDDFEDKNPS